MMTSTEQLAENNILENLPLSESEFDSLFNMRNKAFSLIPPINFVCGNFDRVNAYYLAVLQRLIKDGQVTKDDTVYKKQ